MKFKLFQTLLGVLGCTSMLFAQVSKTVVVEHFTNTRCSACASRNPGFYNNLAAQENVIHVAFHPSSPYASCVISQSNPGENDGRAQYNNVFGGTPTLVIQGTAISPGQNYSSQGLFTPFLNQVSQASIAVQLETDADSVEVRVVVRTEVENTLGSLQLYVALTEDTLNYAAPNGENRHYDVFRKALSGNSGQTINLPAQGDSLVFTFKTPIQSIWNLEQLRALVILQETANRAVVQSARSARSSDTITSIEQTSTGMSIYPNPASENIFLSFESIAPVSVQLHNMGGRLMHAEIVHSQTTLNVHSFAKGIYFIRAEQQGKVEVQKVVVL